MFTPLLFMLLASQALLLVQSKPMGHSLADRQRGNWGRPTSSAASSAPSATAPVDIASATVPAVPASASTAAVGVSASPPASSAAGSVPPAGAGGGETHQVQLINNCGSGEAVFFYEGDRTIAGSRTVSGQLASGAAWLRGFGDCQDSGVNCGLVEFTLLNGGISSADYSLLDGPGLGNHQFTYAMNFAYTGSCTNAPGACSGPSPDQCPHAYWGSDTGGGIPIQCQGDNLGIVITFC
ncbi:hypothetical protein IAU59_000249 [Kwoniella sp. CBS 9459]